MQTLLIGIFGVVGVLGRFWMDMLFIQKGESIFPVYPFPISTLIINCIGSFLIGVVFVLGQQKNIISPELTTALTVGLLGGFTTFSAFSMQSLQLIQLKHYGLALSYLLGSPLLGLGCAYLGVWLGRVAFRV